MGTGPQIVISTVQYSTVQYSSVQYSTVQYSTGPHNVISTNGEDGSGLQPQAYPLRAPPTSGRSQCLSDPDPCPFSAPFLFDSNIWDSEGGSEPPWPPHLLRRWSAAT